MYVNYYEIQNEEKEGGGGGGGGNDFLLHNMTNR